MREVENIEIITPRLLVEKERKRLLKIPNGKDFKTWLGDRYYPLTWMKSQFGDTLTEKDGFTHMNGDRFDNADCKFCGKESDKDEKIVKITFNNIFCDEGILDINICKKCSKDIVKLFKP